MKQYVRRGRRLAAKVIARLRRIANHLAQPSEVELLMASLPAVERAGELAGKVVVITGSTRGIGRVVAQGFAALGARIVINSRDPKAVEATVAEFTGAGGEAVGVCEDASTAPGARRLVAAAVDAFGRLDILINNAAIGRGSEKKAWEALPDEITDTITVNLIGPYLCASAAIEWMLQNGHPGRIINVSSLAGEEAYPEMTPYGVSKFGLEGLTRYLAVDLGTCGITVVTVSLHSLKTEAKARRRWSEAELLPPAESVVPVFEYAATAPGAQVHGRSVAAWRFQQDSFAESVLANPVATSPLLAYPPMMNRGEPVARDPARYTLLDRAENQHGASPKVAQAVAAALAERDPSIYPDQDYERLRAALAREHDLPEDCFVFGNGSWELVTRLLPLFLRPGEEVLSSSPGWFGFHGLLPRFGIANRRIPFALGGNGQRPHHNLEGFIDAIGVKTRMIYLINPANPEGAPLWSEEFEAFLERVPPHLPVVVDEAYIEYADHPGVLQAPRVVMQSERLVIGLRTFSKFYGLAGMRVGYAYTKPAIASLIDRTRQIFNVSALSETAALTALQDDAHRTHVREQSSQQRAWIQQSLDALGLAYVPSQAPFLLVECPCELNRFYQRFEDEKIYLPRFPDLFADKYVMFPVGRSDQNARNLEILRSLI